MRKYVYLAPGIGNWIEVPDPVSKCAHFGPPTGGVATCPTCKGNVELKLFECGIFGDCTPVKEAPGHACCNGTRGQDGKQVPCPHYTPANAGHDALRRASEATSEAEPTPQPPRATLSWTYGVTTVPMRRRDLLPRTLASLKAGGFDRPRLFVDGDSDTDSWRREFDLEVTARYPVIRTAASWTLALWELYARDPHADRYAVFQDDFVTVRNLRAYLEARPYPDKGYCNLYTFPSNQVRASGKGWYASNQNGRGAVALVFNRAAVVTLLASMHLVERPQDKNRGYKAIDGGIVESLKKAGWKEYVHNPSLVQHTGEVSSMGNAKHLLATSFPGENFDAMGLTK